MSEHKLPPARHEASDVPPSFIVAGLASTLVLLLLCTMLAFWLFPNAAIDRRLTLPLPEFPPPRLQVDTRADMDAFLQKETEQLNSSGWIDRAHGIAHIPIGEAMRRIAAQGIPDWPAATQTDR
jgi:hypothetical protein